MALKDQLTTFWKDKLATKRVPLRLIAGAAVLGVVGGAATYGWFALRNLGPKHLPVGVEAVPQSALMTLTVSTDPGAWQRLRRFGTAETQAQWDAVLADWRDRLLRDHGLNFETDIAPWVGDNITLALLPETAGAIAPPSDRDPALTQPLLVLLPIADVAAARATLGEGLDGEVDSRDYRGVELLALPGSTDAPMVAAVLSPQLVLVATTSGAAEIAVDALKGGKSLADLTGYGDAVNQAQDEDAFAQFYLNLPQVTEAIALNAEPPIPAAGLIPFRQNQGLVGSLNLRGDGIHIRGVSWLSAGSDRTYRVENRPSTLTRKLPNATLMMTSGLNLRQVWIHYSQGATAGSLLPFSPDNLRAAVQTATGLNLDADLVPWMEGEFAFAMVESPTATSSRRESQDPDAAMASAELPVGFALLVTVSDRSAAETTLAQLDELMDNRYRFTVETVDLDGIATIRWVSPFQSLVMTHGWLDSETAFFTVGDGVAELLVPSPRRSLAETKLFQTTTALAPKENNGHFFLDAESLLQTQTLFQPLDNSANAAETPQAVTSAIQGLGVTAAIADNRNVIYDVYVVLEKGRRPGALPGAEEDPGAGAEPTPDADADTGTDSGSEAEAETGVEASGGAAESTPVEGGE